MSSCSSSHSLYDVLGVAPSASVHDIRRAFHQLALRLHPDKQKQWSGAVDALQLPFYVVKEAADQLLDSQRRAQYDAQLGVACAREDGVIGDRLDLFEDFDRVEADAVEGVEVYQRECRCGGLYEVVVCGLDSGEPLRSVESERRRRHVVECDSCSLVVEVTATREEDPHAPPLASITERQ